MSLYRLCLEHSICILLCTNTLYILPQALFSLEVIGCVTGKANQNTFLFEDSRNMWTNIHRHIIYYVKLVENSTQLQKTLLAVEY